jgi:phosphate-selective porin OprO/OprP
MSFPMPARSGRLTRAALVAVLMSTTTVAGAAAAAPRAKIAAPSAADLKLEAMQRQIDEMRATMASMQQQRAADPTEQKVAALEAQLAAANQKLAEVTAMQADSGASIIALQAPPAVSVALPNGKPALASADGRFSANLRSTIMFDAAKYFQKDNLPAAVTNRDLNDGTNFRRARFGMDGKLFKDFDYSLIYEFGGSGGEDAGHVYELYAQYTALKPWKIRLGAFEPNIGLTAAVSTSQMPFMERAAPAEVARNVAAGDTRSALQVFGNGTWGDGDSGVSTRWFASLAATGAQASTFNAVATSFSPQSADEQTAIIGRFAVAPFRSTDWQLHLAANGQRVTQPGDTGAASSARYPIQLRDRPELRVDGARLVDTGAIDARGATVLGLEAAAIVKNFTLEAEAFKYRIDRRITGALPYADPQFSGWYVQGTWVLTGEARSYNPGEARIDAPKMNYNFNADAGTFGTVELAARYSSLDLNFHDCGAGRAIPTVSSAACFDAIRGGEQNISTIGLNWYLNPAIRLMLDWQHVDINRLNAAGAQVGQSYNALGLRSQLAF